MLHTDLGCGSMPFLCETANTSIVNLQALRQKYIPRDLGFAIADSTRTDDRSEFGIFLTNIHLTCRCHLLTFLRRVFIRTTAEPVAARS